MLSTLAKVFINLGFRMSSKLREWLMRQFAGTIWGIATAVGAGALGAWASLSTQEIKSSASTLVTTLSEYAIPVGPAWWIFWFIWVGMFSLRQWAISRSRQREFDQVMGTIVHTPNPSMMTRYPGFVLSTRKIVRRSLAAYESSRDPQILEGAISECVSITCAMTSLFAPSMAEASFRGNVMLYWRRADSRFAQVKNRLLAYPLTRGSRSEIVFSEDGLAGALELIVVLSGTNVSTDPQLHAHSVRSVPDIVLPVPHSLFSAADKYQTFPGAPAALLQGTLSVFPTISELEAFCSRELEHPETVKADIIQYFRKGRGSDIKSFLSIRIGDEENAVGVLNIDCREEYLIGRDREFFKSYLALLAPLVVLFEPLVVEYRASQQGLQSAHQNSARSGGAALAADTVVA